MELKMELKMTLLTAMSLFALALSAMAAKGAEASGPGSNGGALEAAGRQAKAGPYTANSTVAEVVSDPMFGGFGRLLFPAHRPVAETMTLAEVSSSAVYMWYSNIKPEKTVEIVNHLHELAARGEEIFYSFYSKEEIAADPSRADTGLFLFRGEPGREFAVMSAGGGFVYVGAMHDSFPQALEASKRGYNAFALIYRPDAANEDLARALAYVHDRAEELRVARGGYSLWGGSAGGRMAAALGNAGVLRRLTGRGDIPQASAVIVQYAGNESASTDDAPTYSCVGTRDGIARWQTMRNRLSALEKLGIPVEFHAYEGLGHGFGLGTGTAAEGWIDEAIAFWERQIKK